MKGKRSKPRQAPAHEAEPTAKPATEDASWEDAAPPEDLTRHSVMRTLYAPLTEAARAKAGDKMALLMGQIDAVEAERKEAMDDCKGRRDSLEGELSALAKEVREGTPQDVPCTIERNYKAAMIRVWRTDTDEVIEERAMTPEELQRELELGGTSPVVPPARSEGHEAGQEGA